MAPPARSALAALFLVAVIALPASPAALASGGQAGEYEALAKIDPALAKTLREADGEERLVVAVRLVGLPDYARQAVRGDHQAAVSALRSWAEYVQAPVEEFIEANGGVVLRKFWIDNVILAEVPARLVKALALHEYVVRIFPNFEMRLLEPVAGERVEAGQQVSSWGVYKVRAPEVWALGYNGSGVRIAVLDTGVDITHPALAGKMYTADPGDPYYPGGWIEFDLNGNPLCSQPYDSQGHGTHVSGTALGGDMVDVVIGVAPGATLMHALVLPGGSGSFASVLAGIEWAVAPYDCQGNPAGMPAHVISMSLGASGYYGNDLLPAIENALLANVVVVAAIGNDGPDTSSNPGNIWGVYGVGATDENDQDAWFSSGEVVNWPSPPSQWPFYDTYPQTYVKPDFSAPGVAIVSAVPGGGYAAWDGTSMATPHVAGTVALILQAMDALDFSVRDLPELVYEILNATAVDLGEPGQDTRFGWGRIDAYEAVLKAREYAKPTGVEGAVYDAVDGSPIPWASVTVLETGRSYGVGEDGSFRIPLDPGNYTLLVEAWGYEARTVQVEVVLLNGTIAGFVSDAVTGDPIAGASVAVEELGIVVQTGADGSFQVSVPPGMYTLTVTAEGYQPASQLVTVAENETVLVQFSLFPEGNGTVYGYVVDSETGQPLEGATVWTYVGAEPVYNTTDASGYYELNLPAGIYEVRARALGYAEAAATVTVLPGELVRLDFALQQLPPAVVVLGNTQYYTSPHIALLLTVAGIPNVVEYADVSQLIADWQGGAVNPAVVVVDHWKADATAPTQEEVETLIGLAELSGASLVFLATPYSGYTGIHGLMAYEAALEAAGYPVPDTSASDWPSAQYVVVNVTQPGHPIFTDVPFDGGSWFYLADLAVSFYADYIAVNFTDEQVEVLALVNDTLGNVVGVGVAEWVSPSGAYWYFLSSWAESYWMQYWEPGADGAYSIAAERVLVNAVKRGLGLLSTERTPDAGAVEKALRLLAPGPYNPQPGPQAYTRVEVYLDRLPHGFVEGRVVDADGNPIPGAVVEALGTPARAAAGPDGRFSMWLPEGSYVLRIEARGYYPATLEVTVARDATVNVGDVALERRLRVAVLYDYSAAIKAALEARGFYAEDYDNITRLAEDLLTGFYDVVVYAGYYGVPFPTQEEFQAFLQATYEAGVGVVWLDSWGNYGYGIKVLSLYTGDPAGVGYSYGDGQVYLLVEAAHRILEGYQPGDTVLIVDYAGADYSWFTGFTGTVLASVYVAGNAVGAAVGVKTSEAGTRWVLLSSFAPTSWNEPAYFTEEAWDILANAARYAATKPLNVTLEDPDLHVGDTALVRVTGAPEGATVTVYFNGAPVGSGVSQGGTATVSFTVPLAPGGPHLVEAEAGDGLYYGFAVLYIMPKLEVEPASFTTPAVVSVNVTGMRAGEPFYIYLDSNLLSLAAADELGSFQGRLNVPLAATGFHEISIVGLGGRVLYTVKVTVVNGLEELNSSILEALAGHAEELRADISSLAAMLEEVNATIVGVVKAETGEVYALVNTTYGLLAAELSAVNASLAGIIVGESGRLEAVINTSIGRVTVELDRLGAEIAEAVADEAGRLALLINSTYGSIVVALDDVNASLAGIVMTAAGDLYAAIQAGTERVLVRIDNSTEAILALLREAEANITGLVASETGRLYALVETSYGDILVAIDRLNASIAGVVAGEAGRILAVVETGLGNVTVSLEEVNATLARLIVDAAGEIEVVINTTLGEVAVKLDEIIGKLPGLEAKAEEAKSEAGRATTVGAAGVTLAAVSLALGAILGRRIFG